MGRTSKGFGPLTQTPDLPIILGHIFNLGNLIYHKAWRMPNDPIYELETIGM